MTFVISLVNEILAYLLRVPTPSRGEKLPTIVIQLLREERLRQNLSMNALAQRSGLSQSSVSLLESGQRKPTLDTLIRICDALSVELWKIFKRATER